MSTPEIPPSTIDRRSASTNSNVGQSDREALARNPNDLQAALRLGSTLLEAKDPHLARLALAQAVQGGGAEVHNLYGVACAQAGDLEGAISGFGRAAVSGLSAGIDNTVKLLSTKLNVSNAKSLTQKLWKVSTTGGVRW